MSFKVMGVTAGRKDSNCEILLKEALYRRHQGMEGLTEEETARIEGMFR